MFNEIICPWCKVVYLPEAMELESGNHQTDCDNCDKQFGYHCEIEISDVYKIESEAND